MQSVENVMHVGCSKRHMYQLKSPFIHLCVTIVNESSYVDTSVPTYQIYRYIVVNVYQIYRFIDVQMVDLGVRGPLRLTQDKRLEGLAREGILIF